MGVTLLALARYTLKGPYQAAAVVGVLAVLSVFIPLLGQNTAIGVLLASVCMLLSCVLVGLIILTQGSASGLRAIAVSVAGLTLVAWLLLDAPQFGLWTALVQWLPIILLAQTLRSSRSLAWTLLAGIGLGVVGISAQHLFWGGLESDIAAQMTAHIGEGGQLDQRIVEYNLQIVELIVQAMVSGALLIVMLILLTARWLQSRLGEAPPFGEEFRALALGKQAAAVGLLALLSSFALDIAWLQSLAFLMLVAFLFQGVAVVHSKLADRRQARMWLSVFYVLLVVFRPLVALIAITGMIDNWVVFRKKPEKPDDENIV